MINHPNRGNSPDALSRRLIKLHALDHIAISYRPSEVVARAMPHSSHPIVQQRRAQAFAAAGGGDFSLKQATEITKGAEGAIAIGRGESFGAAIMALEFSLKKLEIPA